MAYMSKRIPEEIKKRGLKQNFVASRIGIDQNRFSDMVNGRRQIRVEEALILADMFGLDVDEVIQTDQVPA
jgi:plasmid maintenance system antidote protein VapI